MKHGKSRPGWPAATLKWIAMAAMLLDHIGVLFARGSLYIALRVVGRGAFPIFCFLLAEGAAHTRSRGRYALRLLVFALLTEPVFDFAFNGGFFAPESQNVLWTLLLALVCICAAEALCAAWGDPPPWLQAMVWAGTLAMCACGAGLLGTDYGAYGVMLAVCFYMLRASRPVACGAAGLLTLLQGGLQTAALWAGVPILLYNGQKGRGGRWFYLFYPGHLAVLGVAAYFFAQSI